MLDFLNFASSDVQQQYEEHLAQKKKQCRLKVHLFGKVMPTSKVESFHKPKDENVGTIHAFALSRFPGEKEYAAFLMSDVHRQLVKGPDREGERENKEGFGLVEEGMISTNEISLPPKSR